MPAEPRTLTLQAPAKLNLMLRVLAREESGFHQIETLFCAIELADDVEVSVGGDVVTLDIEAPSDQAGPPPDLGPEQQNLAWRAATLFNHELGLASNGAGVHIRLTKRVPAGAGLGGGSSDAAAVLYALNRLHGQPLTDAELCTVGARLGSDIPFFLAHVPLVLAWGRGDRMLPLPPLPVADVLLAVPAGSVPTPDAYAALAHHREEVAEESTGHLDDATGRAARRETVAGPSLLQLPASWADVDALARNDFEDIIFQRLPIQADVREALAELGARPARLTGTGSVVFGVFEEGAIATAAHHQLGVRFPDVTFIRTRTAGARSAADAR